MKELRQASPGDDGTVNYELTAAATQLSGDFVVKGQLPVIAVTDIVNGEKGTYLAEQVIEYDKEDTTATFSEGDVVFFDVSEDEMTNTSDTGTNKVVGIALEAAINTDKTILMKMAPRISDA